MFKIKARYIGAYGREFLAAYNLSYQEALDHIDKVKEHIECVLKSDPNTRMLKVTMIRNADNVSIYVTDERKQYNPGRLLCMLQIIEEDNNG